QLLLSLLCPTRTGGNRRSFVSDSLVNGRAGALTCRELDQYSPDGSGEKTQGDGRRVRSRNDKACSRTPSSRDVMSAPRSRFGGFGIQRIRQDLRHISD